MDLGLAGRPAMVTGAAAGIGRATATWLSRAGCPVALVDRDAERLEQTVEELRADAPECTGIVADLRDDGAPERAVDATVDAFGHLAIAVNNVGMLAGHLPAPFLDQSDAELRDIVEQNLLLTARCCRAEGRSMVHHDVPGVILNVTSGESTRPALDLAAYGAAKSAINHLTQTLATELGPSGIRVNAVAPGTTLTEVVRAALSDEYVAELTATIPLLRMTEPDDLARLVVALASDLGRAVTGQLVLADNGAHLSRNRPPRERPARGRPASARPAPTNPADEEHR
ncbi:MAG: SDR family oxidoreductase [Acidimicrobiia bacterium]